MIELITTKRTDERLLERMKKHYSHPKGFVGRNICYAIVYNSVYYGHIVGGSATRFLPGRHDFLKTTIDQLNNIVNNIFFNINPINGKYPKRNFTSFVVKEFVKTIACDWEEKYEDIVLGFETLIEKPRKGTLYIRAGWQQVGETIGYTCKRIAGTSSDKWSGRRVWNTNKKELRPKRVLCLNYNQSLKARD